MSTLGWIILIFVLITVFGGGRLLLESQRAIRSVRRK